MLVAPIEFNRISAYLNLDIGAYALFKVSRHAEIRAVAIKSSVARVLAQSAFLISPTFN